MHAHSSAWQVDKSVCLDIYQITCLNEQGSLDHGNMTVSFFMNVLTSRG